MAAASHELKKKTGRRRTERAVKVAPGERELTWIEVTSPEDLKDTSKHVPGNVLVLDRSAALAAAWAIRPVIA